MTVVNDSLSLLLPELNMYQMVLISIIDAGTCTMIKSKSALDVFYQIMIHISCLADSLYKTRCKKDKCINII